MTRETHGHDTRGALRVAVLDHTAEAGGAELALARVAAALDPQKVELHLVTFAPGPLVDLVKIAGHSAEVVALPRAVLGVDRRSAGGVFTAVSSAIQSMPSLWRLARRVREIDADVIHTTSLKADLVGVAVALVARRPLVWHVHDRIAPDYLPMPLVRLMRVLARLVPAHVIANSLATAETLPGVRGLTVVHPGLAPGQVLEAPRSMPVPGDTVVGVLGRISPTKAQLVFVRAAAILAATRPEVRFRIIGGATFGAERYANEVRAEVERLGLSGRVDFTGHVRDPRPELDALTVCVHTSSIPEPFGQVVVEAMARGVPVVATLGGGIDEIMIPASGERLGWVVPPGDPVALAQAIEEALADPYEAAQRARRAHELVLSLFTIDRTASALTKIWMDVAQRAAAKTVTTKTVSS